MEPLHDSNPEDHEVFQGAGLIALLDVVGQIVDIPDSLENTDFDMVEGRQRLEIQLSEGYRIIYEPALPGEEDFDSPRALLWLVNDTEIDGLEDLEGWVAMDLGIFTETDAAGEVISDTTDLATLPMLADLDPEGMMPDARTTSRHISFLGPETTQISTVAYGRYEQAPFATAVSESQDIRLADAEIEEWLSRLEAYRDRLANR